jgi:DNA invertase Pin-like site-specific DNA recombinase
METVTAVNPVTSPKQYIPYYRVSTDRQGKSGLGLDAQRLMVASVTGNGTILQEYTEVESGKRSVNRPQLQDAMSQARSTGATLVFAKLDRMARNVRFTAELIESDIDFIFADDPTFSKDDPAMTQMRAVFAEEEARRISQRTKAALAARKARGLPTTVECVRANTKNHPTGPKVPVCDQNAASAEAYAWMIKPVLVKIVRDGYGMVKQDGGIMEGGALPKGKMSLGWICDALEAGGVKTSDGGTKWHRNTVRRLLSRMGLSSNFRNASARGELINCC